MTGFRSLLLCSILAFAIPANAQVKRAIMEGTAASSNAIFVDTTNVRVGVGTAAPSYRLDVQGDIRSTGTIYGKIAASSVDFSTITTAIGLRVAKAGDTMTGTLAMSASSITFANGGIRNVDYVQLNTSYADGQYPGRFEWDTDHGLPQIGLVSGVNGDIFDEMLTYAMNDTASTITNGSVVYQKGVSGGGTGHQPTIGLADCATNNEVLGVATQDIAPGAWGYVTPYGDVHDINTTGGHTSDPAYLSATPGQFTDVIPTTCRVVRIGSIRYSHAINGVLRVDMQIVPNNIYVDSVRSTNFYGAFPRIDAALSTAAYTTGSYANPAWITSLATSKIDLSTVTAAISAAQPVGAAYLASTQTFTGENTFKKIGVGMAPTNALDVTGVAEFHSGITTYGTGFYNANSTGAIKISLENSGSGGNMILYGPGGGMAVRAVGDTGVVYATSFDGAATGLTAIPANRLTGGVPTNLVDLSTVTTALGGKLSTTVTVPTGLIDLSTVTTALSGKLSTTVTVPAGLIDLSTVTTALAGKLSTGGGSLSGHVTSSSGITVSSVTVSSTVCLGVDCRSSWPLGNITSTAAIVSSISAIQTTFVDVKDPTGFLTNTTSSITFSGSTFQIAGTSFPVYLNGVKLTKSTATVSIPTAASNLNWVYYDLNGDLVTSGSFPGFYYPLVSTVYYSTSMAAGLTSDERHGASMSWRTHEWAHETIGARYALGMSWTYGTIGSAVVLTTVTAGEYYDDDLEIITPQSNLFTVLYHNNSSDWSWNASTAAYYTTIAGNNGRAYWNNGNILTQASGNVWIAYWMYASAITNAPYIIVTGNRTDTSLANAQANSTPPVITGLPAAELRLIARVIIRSNNGPVTLAGVDDYRSVSSLPTSGVTPSAHSGLSGLGLTVSGHPYDLTGGFQSFDLFDSTATNLQNRVGVLEGNVSTTVFTTGSYANPSWITSLATSKIDLSTVTAGMIPSTATGTYPLNIQTVYANGTTHNVAVGLHNGYGQGTNTVLGDYAGQTLNVASASGNTFIGYSAGTNMADGDGNIAIGPYAPGVEGSDQLFIGNANDGYVMKGGMKVNNSTITFIGAVSATNFIGNGAGLTGISASGGVSVSTFTIDLHSGGDVFVASGSITANMGMAYVAEIATITITGVRCYTLYSSSVSPTSFNIMVSTDIGANTGVGNYIFTSSVTVNQNATFRSMYSGWTAPDVAASVYAPGVVPMAIALQTVAVPAKGTMPSEYGCTIRYWRRLD